MRFKSFSTSTSQASPDCFLDKRYSYNAIKLNKIKNTAKTINDFKIKLINIPVLKQNLINVSTRRMLTCLIFNIHQLSVILIYFKTNIITKISRKPLPLRSGYAFEYIGPNAAATRRIRYN